MIQLIISPLKFPPELQAIYSRTSAKTIVKLAGKSVERGLRKHFLAHKPNKRGWPSRGLWGEIAERTAAGNASGDKTYASIEVTVSHPAFNLKVFGGTVRPKRVRFLTIPATAAAYAAGSPREGATPQLKLDFVLNPETGREQRALVQVEESESAEAGTVWYWLARKTEHDPDPDALPDDLTLQAQVDDTIRAFLERSLARETANES